jgi:hypothetical protein
MLGPRILVGYFQPMIIEAGYDLHMLFDLALSRSKRDAGVWVIAMDEDLRLSALTRVRGASRATLGDNLSKVAKTLRTAGVPNTRYYALATLARSSGRVGDGEFERQDDLIRTAAVLAEFRLLGTCLFDAEGWHSSIPRYSFRDYVGLEYLPRSASWPGPHTFPCDCLACSQFEERLRRNREAHRSDLDGQS